MADRGPGTTGTTRNGRKFVRRSTIWIQRSLDLTARGNPRDITFVYECGHSAFEHYNAGVFGLEAVFVLSRRQGKPVDVVRPCYDCGRGDGLDWLDKLRIGRLPMSALEQEPRLAALWEQAQR